MDRLFAIMLVPVIGVLASCSPLASHPPDAVSVSDRCGVHAMLFGRAEDPDHPPACALPTAWEVASSCSIRDAQATPGFRIPEYDEMGEQISGTQFPRYLAEGLACEFTDDRRNRAQCTFRLIKPAEPDRSINYRATLEYSVGLIDSTVIHGYQEVWSVDGSCQGAD